MPLLGYPELFAKARLKKVTKRSQIQIQIMACDKYRYSELTALQIRPSRFIMI
jgi:hypothetical protein